MANSIAMLLSISITVMVVVMVSLPSCSASLYGTRAADGVLPAEQCTAITVGRKASLDSSTMTTHTDDCIDCDFRLARVPARDHAKGSLRPIMPARFAYPRYIGYERGDTFHPSRVVRHFPWNNTVPIGYIPQVPHTYAYLDGGYGIQNEKQVSIGESTCGAKLVAKPIYAGGSALFDISELGRVALERCDTARCAIQTMGDLATSHGYYGCEWEGDGVQAESGETFSVTDKHEAWVFHMSPDDTGASAVWVAQRVPDDHIAVVANGFIIRGIDVSDTDNFMASANIFEVAKRANLWNPSTDGAFDFQGVYGLRVSVYHEEYIARRWWRVLSLAAPSLGLRGNMTTTELPFSVKVDKLLTPKDIMTMNRDHFEGTPYDMTQGVQGGPFGNPNRYDMYSDDAREVPAKLMVQGHFERPVSMFRTSYSFVSQSRAHLPDEIGARIWFGNHAPHGTCYAPFYAAASHIPEAYQSGSLHAFDHDSAWWAFCAVANYAERAYRYIIQDVQAEYNAFEQTEFEESEQAEKHALKLLKSEGSDAAKEYLDSYTSANAKNLVSTWWALFYRIIGKYHDGYRLDNPHVQTIDPYKLSFPRWWLEAIGYWKQPPGDLASHSPPVVVPPPNESQMASPTSMYFSNANDAAAAAAVPITINTPAVATGCIDTPAAASSSSSISTVMVLICSCVSLLAGIAIGHHRASSSHAYQPL